MNQKFKFNAPSNLSKSPNKHETSLQEYYNSQASFLSIPLEVLMKDPIMKQKKYNKLLEMDPDGKYLPLSKTQSALELKRSSFIDTIKEDEVEVYERAEIPYDKSSIKKASLIGCR